ncbi:MAG: hypothetical protein ABR964_12695 [Tepidisphaeraceae bacterium]|jgi:chromosome segregation ATPase
MIRFITGLNFLGVLAVAVLCAAQWQTNSRLSLRAGDLEKIRQQQTAKLSEQEKSLKDDAADLDDLRRRLELSESDLADTHKKLELSNAQCDQLKNTLTQWQRAVADRDAALKQAGQQIQKIAAERNDAVQKFNDLADKYNTLVKDAHGSQ